MKTEGGKTTPPSDESPGWGLVKVTASDARTHENSGSDRHVREATRTIDERV